MQSQGVVALGHIPVLVGIVHLLLRRERNVDRPFEFEPPHGIAVARDKNPVALFAFAQTVFFPLAI